MSTDVELRRRAGRAPYHFTKSTRGSGCVRGRLERVVAEFGVPVATLAVLAGCAVVAGCGAEQAPETPVQLSLTGSAFATEGDLAIACAFSAVILVEEESSNGWTGAVLEGRVGRELVTGGERHVFEALLAGPASLALAGGETRLRFVGDQSAGRPFWRAIETLVGTGAGRRAEGSWGCHPLDLVEPGFTDTTGVALGAWTLGVSGAGYPTAEPVS